MIEKSTIKFLKDLKANNNREWFKDNKKRYDDAKADFVEYLAALLPKIAKFDDSISHVDPSKAVFRIYRDTRFSKDKTPYKVNIGAHITSGAKSDVHGKAGYYIHIEPGKSMLAGGAYLPPSKWLNAIRQEIDYNAADLKKILKAKSFQTYFGEMEGEKLKTAPKGFPKDHPEIELLRYKSFLATHYMKDSMVTSNDMVNHSSKVFKALYPFDQFLNRAQE